MGSWWHQLLKKVCYASAMRCDAMIDTLMAKNCAYLVNHGSARAHVEQVRIQQHYQTILFAVKNSIWHIFAHSLPQCGQRYRVNASCTEAGTIKEGGGS
jgi:hypothetical protein